MQNPFRHVKPLLLILIYQNGARIPSATSVFRSY